MTTYTYQTQRVTIVNGKVTYSDTALCTVGQAPNLKVLKACGWKKEKSPRPSYAKGLPNGRNFYN